MKKYCFCFVCERGFIEIQAILLAFFLKKNVKCPYDIVVGIPNAKPHKRTLKFFEELNVKAFVDGNSPIQGYLHGNKLTTFANALEVSDADYFIFLDSDIVCQREFYGVEGIQDYDISMRLAKQASNNDTWTTKEEWKPVYDSFGLKVPEKKYVREMSQQTMLPYFNAGFIAVKKGSMFPKKWIEVAQKIELNENIQQKRPWLDQIAIPIVIELLQFSYQCLGSEYNSWESHQKEAIFHHYHYTEHLISIEECSPFIVDFFKMYPGFIHLLEQVCTSSDWKKYSRKIEDLTILQNFIKKHL
jgi:hypothetical protein